MLASSITSFGVPAVSLTHILAHRVEGRGVVERRMVWGWERVKG